MPQRIRPRTAVIRSPLPDEYGGPAQAFFGQPAAGDAALPSELPIVKMLRLGLLCICLAGYPVEPARSQTVVDSSADESTLHAFLHEPFETPLGYSLVLANASERVRMRFGTPDSEESARYRSRTSDELLRSTVFSYEGMTILIGESEDGAASWIEAIEITSPAYPLRFGLEIGARRDEVFDAFPSPYAANESELRYDAEIWETRTDTKYRRGEAVTVLAVMELTFRLDDRGRVARISITSIDL